MKMTQIADSAGEAAKEAQAAEERAKRMPDMEAPALVATVDGIRTASCLQLRSRSLLIAYRRDLSPPLEENSSAASAVEGDSLRSLSSSARSEVVSKDFDGSWSSPRCLSFSREKRETTPTSELRIEADDLEDSAVGVRSRKRPRTEKTRTSSTITMPSDIEIEEFFATAERDEKQQFANKYNFDIINDLPLEGRYEWFQI